MTRFAAWAMAACLAALGFVPAAAAAAELTAAEIVEKNAAARGGVDAWRNMQTMAWAGHVESASAPARKLPFVLEQKRPDRTRFEIVADGARSIRVYDGNEGWKLRPNAGGKPDLQPYSAEELRFARGAQVIDGPLMDYAAKGGVISLDGVDAIDGRKAYVLDVKLPSGGGHRVWVDAETFLELRHDRDVRNAAGQRSTVTVFYRDYGSFDGLQIAQTVETSAGAGNERNKLVIERVALNPVLDDRMFSKPSAPVSRRRGVTVDTRGTGPAKTGAP